MPDPKRPSETPSELDEFIDESRKFFSSMLAGIQKGIGDHEDAPLIRSHGDAVQKQFGNLVTLMKTRYDGSSTEARRQVDELMRVQAVTTLASNGRAAFETSVAQGAIGDGTFSWIESIVEEIKKLVDIVFEIFGGKPKWLDTLIQIIDEILKAVLGLFGGALGRNRSRISSDLSKMEVEFWNEIGSRRRASVTLNGDDSDDDD